MSWPVVWLDLSLNKKATILAISSAVVIRFPKGIFSVIFFNVASGSGKLLIHFSYKGVKLSATITAFTRIPYFKSSTAHSLVREFLAPLAAA
jgi:hypothetical protein